MNAIQITSDFGMAGIYGTDPSNTYSPSSWIFLYGGGTIPSFAVKDGPLDITCSYQDGAFAPLLFYDRNVVTASKPLSYIFDIDFGTNLFSALVQNTVTFEKPYATIPTIVATVVGQSLTDGAYFIQVGDATTTGFTFTILGTSTARKVNWLSFGLRNP